MKALEILYIMIIFNLVIWMFSFMGLGADSLSPVSPTDTGDNLIFNLDFEDFLLTLAGASIIISLFAKQNTVQTILYQLGFSGVFWGTYISTSHIFESILFASPYSTGIWLVFTTIVGIVFIIGFIQFSTGSLKYYD